MFQLMSHPAGKFPPIPITVRGGKSRKGGGGKFDIATHQCVVTSEIMSCSHSIQALHHSGFQIDVMSRRIYLYNSEVPDGVSHTSH